MTGAIASTVLTLVVVPLVHFMVEKRHDPQPLPPAWAGASPDAPEEDENDNEVPELED